MWTPQHNNRAPCIVVLPLWVPLDCHRVSHTLLRAVSSHHMVRVFCVTLRTSSCGVSLHHCRHQQCQLFCDDNIARKKHSSVWCVPAPPAVSDQKKSRESSIDNADAQAAQGCQQNPTTIPGWPVAFRAVPLLQITRLCVSLNVSRGSCVLLQNLGQDIHHDRP